MLKKISLILLALLSIFIVPLSAEAQPVSLMMNGEEYIVIEDYVPTEFEFEFEKEEQILVLEQNDTEVLYGR